MSKQSEIPGVAAVIAVASGKGGVGKSTPRSTWRWVCAISVCASVSRCRHLRPVGARLTGIHEKPVLDDNRKMVRSSASAFDHVDRLPGRGRYRDDLARPDGDVGDHQMLRDVRGARSIFSSSTCRLAPVMRNDTGAERPLKGAVIISTRRTFP